MSYAPLTSPMRATCPAHLILLALITLTILGEDHFPCLRSFQSIRPVPRPFVTFRDVIHFLRWGVVSPLPNPQAGGPPLVGCPRLLIQYIRSYPPYLDAFSSIRNLRTRHAVVTRDPLNMEINILTNVKTCPLLRGSDSEVPIVTSCFN
jgi:hypothetical protein